MTTDKLCPHCGCDLEEEKEMFSQDKLFTGHNCKGENCPECKKGER